MARITRYAYEVIPPSIDSVDANDRISAMGILKIAKAKHPRLRKQKKKVPPMP